MFEFINTLTDVIFLNYSISNNTIVFNHENLTFDS